MSSTDAITLLKQDHKKVKGLFTAFEGAKLNPEKTLALAEQIFGELTVHTTVEEEILYPVARQDESLRDLVAESFQEHHMVKLSITELQGMDPKHELYRAKMTVLIENVKHHIEEEEEEMFPKLRKALSRKVLQEVGAMMLARKKTVDDHPAPESLDRGGRVLLGKLQAGAPVDLS